MNEMNEILLHFSFSKYKQLKVLKNAVILNTEDKEKCCTEKKKKITQTE